MLAVHILALLLVAGAVHGFVTTCNADMDTDKCNSACESSKYSVEYPSQIKPFHGPETARSIGLFYKIGHNGVFSPNCICCNSRVNIHLCTSPQVPTTTKWDPAITTLQRYCGTDCAPDFMKDYKGRSCVSGGGGNTPSGGNNPASGEVTDACDTSKRKCLECTCGGKIMKKGTDICPSDCKSEFPTQCKAGSTKMVCANARDTAGSAPWVTIVVLFCFGIAAVGAGLYYWRMLRGKEDQGSASYTSLA